MNRNVVAICLLVSLILLPIATVKPINASSKTLTVPDNYSTIQQAITASNDGDTILVRKGTYNEQLVIDKQVFLRGEDKANTIITTSKSGAIILVSHSNVEITGFTVQHDSIGSGYPLWYWSSGKAAIHLLNVEHCNIYGNQIVSRGCGVWLYTSNQNNVYDNVIQECDYGITVQSSNGNTLSRNTMANNTYGLSFMDSSNNVLRNNDLHDNSKNLAISSSDLSGYFNNMDASNLVAGKPIYYWIDQSDQSVPSDAGCVVLVNCKQIKVEGLNLSATNQAAIILAGTQGCTVTNNEISGSSIGIQIFNSLYDGIFNNNINTGEGIESNGNGTIIQNNNIKANTGISIGGYYQTITGNTINAKETGDYTITCSGSYNNITQNTLEAAMRGLSISGSNNIFYSNNIINCYVLRVSSMGNIIAKNTLIGCTLTIDEGSKNIICTNTISRSGTAINLVFAKDNTFYANNITNNGVGITLGSDAAHLSGNKFYNNNFIANEKQVGKNNLKNTANFWDNGKEGNYWSDRDQTSIYKPYEVKSTYHVPAKEENIEFICGKDNFPLKNPYNISNAIIALPEWIDPAKPSTIIQPQDSNVNKPSTTQPTDQSQLLPIAVIVATIIMATITVTLALYLKRRSKR
jgi:parallel beta-helix repeat protein